MTHEESYTVIVQLISPTNLIQVKEYASSKGVHLKGNTL